MVFPDHGGDSASRPQLRLGSDDEVLDPTSRRPVISATEGMRRFSLKKAEIDF
jgi:hypothetical protein